MVWLLRLIGRQTNEAAKLATPYLLGSLYMA